MGSTSPPKYFPSSPPFGMQAQNTVTGVQPTPTLPNPGIAAVPPQQGMMPPQQQPPESQGGMGADVGGGGNPEDQVSRFRRNSANFMPFFGSM